MSTLQTLKDPSGEIIYPATHAKATLIERNNSVIDLQDYSEEIDQTLDTCVKKPFITVKIFDTTQSYSRSELVWYENKLYIFKNSKTAGAWDSTKVKEVTDLGSVFQTKYLETPLLVGSMVQGDIESAVSGLNTIVGNQSTNIETLNTNVSSLSTNKQDKLTAGTNITISSNTISASFPIAVNQFDKANLFSTTEKVIGCWTDGRPLYQKTIDCGALPNNTVKSVTTGVSNILLITSIKGVAYKSDANVYPLSVTYNDDIKNQIKVNWNSNYNNIELNTKANWSSYSAYVTIQYTKTTDAANSFKYADENDYSTTEHIIGTWITGKPIYQKTVSFGALPNKTAKTVNHGISNLNYVVDVKCVAKRSSDTVFMPIPRAVNDSSGKGDCVDILIKSTVVQIQDQTSDQSGFSECYVTIQYTKTTD